jgi:hypothetical protein
MVTAEIYLDRLSRASASMIAIYRENPTAAQKADLFLRSNYDCGGPSVCYVAITVED